LDDKFSECRCSGCDQEPLASLQVRFLEHCKSRHWIDKSLTRRLIRHCIGHRNHQGCWQGEVLFPSSGRSEHNPAARFYFSRFVSLFHYSTRLKPSTTGQLGCNSIHASDKHDVRRIDVPGGDTDQDLMSLRCGNRYFTELQDILRKSRMFENECFHGVREIMIRWKKIR